MKRTIIVAIATLGFASTASAQLPTAGLNSVLSTGQQQVSNLTGMAALLNTSFADPAALLATPLANPNTLVAVGAPIATGLINNGPALVTNALTNRQLPPQLVAGMNIVNNLASNQVPTFIPGIAALPALPGLPSAGGLPLALPALPGLGTGLPALPALPALPL